jgi:hypothetical protein
LQGLHNIFVVIPQFLVSGLSAIMFAIFDPVQVPKAGAMSPPLPVPSSPANEGANATHARAGHNIGVAVKFMNDVVGMVVRDPAEEAEKNERGGQSNSVVYILRWVLSIDLDDVVILTAAQVGGCGSACRFYPMLEACQRNEASMTRGLPDRPLVGGPSFPYPGPTEVID